MVTGSTYFIATGSTGEDYYGGDYGEVHTSKNINAPKGVHIMNKNESAALRRLKQETGLTEEELRKEKKYRKILSDAQKQKGTKTDRDRFVLGIVKSATQHTKLAAEHPKTIQKINEIIEERKKYCYWRANHGIDSANSILTEYKQIKKREKISKSKK
jgi:hypothetical protein